MLGFSVSELLIILSIVIILFGVGRITRIAKEIGQGIRLFREGIRGNSLAEPPDSPKHEKFDDLDDF